jgi:predicted metal-dependent peptidase
MPLTESQVEEIRNAVQGVISILVMDNPFLGLLLRKTWVFVEDCGGTAYTDGLKIVLCYDWFSKLGRDVANGGKNQMFVLLHELMHIILGHTTRSKEYIRRYRRVLSPEVVNAVADAKVNQYLTEFRTTLPIITPEWLEKTFDVKNVEEKSFEEILEEISRKAKVVKVKVLMPDLPEDSEGEKGDGTEGEGEGKSRDRRPVNEGDREDEGAGREDEMDRRRREKIAETLVTAKMAGMLPAGLERLVNDLLKSEVDWRRLLLLTLTKGIGTKVKRTWSRPSRKLPFAYPGKETLRLNKVLVLVDTSGSIGEQELRRFVSEVYGILKESAEVVVIPWDAQAYDPIVLRSTRDIGKLKAGLKGGGGTCILPALEVVDKRFSGADMIVILSDWEIYDIGSSEVQQLLRKYASRILAFTTYAKPPEYLRSFKIRID